MQHQILDEARIHPSIREKIANFRIATVETVRAAVKEHDVVVVGMSQNPFPNALANCSTEREFRTTTSDTVAISANGTSGYRSNCGRVGLPFQ